MTEKVWSAGDILTAADQNRYPVQQVWAVKSADEGIASTATLQDDDHLFFPVTANTRYFVQAYLMYAGAASSSSMEIAFTAPAAATFDWTPRGVGMGGGNPGSYSINPLTLADTWEYSTSTTLPYAATPCGVLAVGANAGTFKLQWDQSSSGVGTLTMKARSVLHAIRMTT